MGSAETSKYKLGLDGLSFQTEVLTRIVNLLAETVDELNRIKENKEDSHIFDLYSKYLMLMKEIKKVKRNVGENLVFLKNQLSFFVGVSEQLSGFDKEVESLILGFKYGVVRDPPNGDDGGSVQAGNGAKATRSLSQLHHSITRLLAGRSATSGEVRAVKKCRSNDTINHLYRNLRNNRQHINLLTYENFNESFRNERSRIEYILPIIQHNVANYQELLQKLDKIQCDTERIMLEMKAKKHNCAIV